MAVYSFYTIRTVGTSSALIMALEDGREDQYPRVEISAAGATIPVVIIDLEHKRKGRYEGAWTPSAVGTYSAYYFVYSDAARTIENLEYGREIEQIEVTNVSIDDIAAKIARILGLAHENSFIDKTVFDPFSQLTQCRIRIFDSQAHAALATDGGSETDGLIATYEMTASYEAVGRLETYRYLRIS